MAHRLLAALLLTTAAASAEQSFGARGQVVPFGGLSFRHTSQNGVDTNSVSLEPGALWFVANSVAIGASALYGYTKGVPLGGQTAPLTRGFHSVGVAPIIGVALPLADRLALFPRFSIRFLWEFPDGPGGSLDLITMRGFAPVVFTPASHFYFGFGPEFSADLSSSAGKETAFGLATEIGGYF
jgi:hypothetical protein